MIHNISINLLFSSICLLYCIFYFFEPFHNIPIYNHKPYFNHVITILKKKKKKSFLCKHFMKVWKYYDWHSYLSVLFVINMLGKKKTAQYSHCNRGKYIFLINAKYSFIAGEKYLWPIHFYLPLAGGYAISNTYKNRLKTQKR